MVKKMGTVFEKNMNLHREIDWGTDNGRDEKTCGSRDHSSRSMSSRVANPREKAVALPAAVPSRRA